MEGIDIIFVGPYDLSQSLGVTGQTDHPEVVAMVERTAARCHERGIAVGTFVELAEDARRWRTRGVHYLCYAVDVGIFYNACQDIATTLRA